MQIKNNDNDTEDQMPWNALFREAKAGDRNALRKLHMATEPLITSFYRVPVFYNKLGREEIRSLASFALVRYFSQHTGLPPDAEVPCLLKHVIYCALVSGVRKVNTRKSFEQASGSAGEEAFFPGRKDDEEEEDAGATATADRETEPEARYLRDELRHIVREAVRKLKEKEQTVIRGIYYQHKSTTALAREMHCSPQSVRYTRRIALTHLQELLKACGFA